MQTIDRIVEMVGMIESMIYSRSYNNENEFIRIIKTSELLIQLWKLERILDENRGLR